MAYRIHKDIIRNRLHVPVKVSPIGAYLSLSTRLKSLFLLAVLPLFVLMGAILPIQNAQAAGEVYAWQGSGDTKITAQSGFWSDWTPAASDGCGILDGAGDNTVLLCRSRDKIYQGEVNKRSLGECTFTVKLSLDDSKTKGTIEFTPKPGTKNDITGKCDVTGLDDKRLKAPATAIISGTPPKEIDVSDEEVASGDTSLPEKWVMGDLAAITGENKDRFTDEHIEDICGDYWLNGESDHFDRDKYNLCVQNAKDHRDSVEATDEETNCIIEGIGWIVCPVVTAGAAATDALYTWISGFLVTQPLNMDTGANDNTTYIAWKIMRNLANIAFVITFLIIIFSQLTGAGISNYGVKKMLPRLVIAAILVNLSYWVTAIAVDLSNIIGNNTYNILRNLPLGNISPQDNLAETITGWALGGSAALALGIWGTPIAISAAGTLGIALFWAVAAIVLIAGLSLLLAFLVMALRQAMIIILIIVSPLAFVAYLLPNTEKYFNLWRKSLTTLLVFYPLFSLLFGGAYVASMVILGSAGQQNNEAATGMLVVVGMAVQFIPLFITPLLIKFSTGVVGQVAEMVNNKNKGLIDRAKKARNKNFSLGMREGLSKPGGRKNPFRAMYRYNENKKRSDASREAMIDMVDNQAYANTLSYTNDPTKTDEENTKGRARAEAAAKRAGGIYEHGSVLSSANAQAVLDDAETKARKAASIPLQAEITKIKAAGGDIDQFLMSQMQSASSKVTKEAAAHIAASLGRSNILRTVKETGSTEDKQMVESAVSANAGALVGKAPDLVKGTGPAFNSMNGKTLAGLSKDTAKSYVQHLESLHKSALTGGDTEKSAFNEAMSAFSSSVEDIRRDTSLQGDFKIDVGQEIKNTFVTTTSAGFDTYAPSSIGKDGKIR